MDITNYKKPEIPEKYLSIYNLDSFDKLQIYMHYYITQLSLKCNFEFVEKYNNNWNNGWGIATKETNNLAYYYLWENLPIYSFDEFISLSRIEIRNNGQNWKEKGYAQEIWIQAYGIFEWYDIYQKQLLINKKTND